jgi:hypothetical protein
VMIEREGIGMTLSLHKYRCSLSWNFFIIYIDPFTIKILLNKIVHHDHTSYGSYSSKNSTFRLWWSCVSLPSR